MSDKQVADIAYGLSDRMREEWLSLEWTGEYYNPPIYFRKNFAELGMTDPHFDHAVTTLGHSVREWLNGEHLK